MIDFKKELDCCYRVSSQKIGKWEKVLKTFKEYYVRGGENCIIQYPNIYFPFCYIHIFDEIIPYNLPMNENFFSSDGGYYSKFFTLANKLRKILMVYDFCLTKLRGIEDMEQRKKSKYRKIKFLLENKINNKDLDLNFKNIGFSDRLLQKLDERCKYLTYASGLEWKGTIKLSTLNKFHTIEGLNNYINERGLTTSPEGKVGSKIIGRVSDADETYFDPIHESLLIESELEHFQCGKKIKSKRALKLAKEIEKETEIFEVFADYLQEIEEKLDCAQNEKEIDDLNDEYKKAAEICVENSIRIPLLDPVDEEQEFELE